MLARAVRGAPQAAGDVQRTLSVMDDWVLDASVDQIRAFVSVLGALKLSKRQLVQVSVAERGVTIVAQDLSKSLQAQVNFRAETFLSYRVNAAAAGTQGHHGTTSAGSAVGTFGLDLGSLIDVLNAFAPLDGECDLSMRWPDRDNALVLAAVTSRDGAEPERPVRSCMHASIAPEVDGWSTTSAADAELIFRGERNAFMMPVSLFFVSVRAIRLMTSCFVYADHGAARDRRRFGVAQRADDRHHRHRPASQTVVLVTREGDGNADHRRGRACRLRGFNRIHVVSVFLFPISISVCIGNQFDVVFFTATNPGAGRTGTGSPKLRRPRYHPRSSVQRTRRRASRRR